MDTELLLQLPTWVPDFLRDQPPTRHGDAARMRVAMEAAQRNVLAGSGGPFGAAIFTEEHGELLSIGVNRVVPSHNCTLHAEMLAFMFAQQRVQHFSLSSPHQPACTLYTSCAPCAMCLGATLWSGVTRVVVGARREDASAIGFDEGPVFEASWDYLAARGIVIVRDVLRDECRDVLTTYHRRGGLRYNGQASEDPA